MEAIFKPGGLLSSQLRDYEFRPSQLRMATAVLDTILSGGCLCVEAGTGTGKTLSYLIPALFSQKRVMVSTATKNLQDQILSKDIPFLKKTLLPGLKAVSMKGRQNYLCLRRLHDRGKQQWLAGVGAGAQWDELEAWSRRTETGERSELTWLADDDELWNWVDARGDYCVGQKCPHFKDCFVTRMRQAALEADLIVVNHALFFANLAIETDEIGGVLPDFGVLILDEAHDVEDIASENFGERLSNFQIEDLCRNILQPLKSGDQDLISLVGRVETAGRSLFGEFPRVEGRHSLNFFRDEQLGAMSDLRERFGGESRRLRLALEALSHRLEQDRPLEDETDPLLRRIDRSLKALSSLFDRDDPGQVYWFERTARGVFLHLTPIDIAPVLREKLFRRSESTILTSATLTAEKSFDFIRERLGLPEGDELAVPGEFDFSRQAVLYVPRRLPEPNAHGYWEYLLQEIRSLLRLTDGHAFLLFTSTSQMQRTYDELVRLDEYPLLCQGRMPKARLLEQFLRQPRSVLCATSSFWQGVDVRGDALRCVAIDKLPFQVPTEPLVAARLHHLRLKGKDPFREYSLPNAIIALRQGLGRLIRSRKDTGILAVLDSRLWSRKYGNLFFDSLPNCPVADNMNDLENFFAEIGSSH